MSRKSIFKAALESLTGDVSSPVVMPASDDEATGSDTGVVEVQATASAVETPPVTPQEAVDAAVAPELETEVHLDMADVIESGNNISEAGDELKDNAEQLQNASTAVQELDNLATDAEESGVDTDASRVLLDVAIEHIYNRLDIPKPMQFAMEDAAGLQVTMKDKISNIREQVIRLLRVIIDGIKRAAAAVTQFLRNLFDTVERLRSNSRELRKIVDSLKVVKVGTISNEAVKKAIAVEKHSNLLAAYDNMVDLVEHAYETASSSHIDYFAHIVEEFVKGEDIEKLYEDFPRVLERVFDDRLQHDETNQYVDLVNQPEKTRLLTSGIMPGGSVAVLTMPDGSTLDTFSFQVVRLDEVDKYPDLHILTVEEMKAVLKKVDYVLEIIAKFKSFSSVIKRVEDRLEQAIKKLDKKSDLDITGQDKHFLKLVSHFAPSIAAGIHERSFAYAVRTCAMSLRYVELCTKQTLPGNAAALKA